MSQKDILNQEPPEIHPLSSKTPKHPAVLIDRKDEEKVSEPKSLNLPTLGL